MELIGLKVKHTAFGVGVITDLEYFLRVSKRVPTIAESSSASSLI